MRLSMHREYTPAHCRPIINSRPSRMRRRKRDLVFATMLINGSSVTGCSKARLLSLKDVYTERVGDGMATGWWMVGGGGGASREICIKLRECARARARILLMNWLDEFSSLNIWSDLPPRRDFAEFSTLNICLTIQRQVSAVITRPIKISKKRALPKFKASAPPFSPLIGNPVRRRKASLSLCLSSLFTFGHLQPRELSMLQYLIQREVGSKFWNSPACGPSFCKRCS